MATIDWNLRSRAHACMKCAAPFEAGAPVRTAVLPFEAPLVAELFAEKLAEEAAAVAAGAAPKPHPDYVRLDFCEACWKALPPETPWISAWRSVYEPPPADPVDPVKKADHESLLRSLLEGPEPENWLPEIYLLAILLERKRILVERRVTTAPDGTRVHIYEHRRSGDILLVADPAFTADRIPETQARIEKLLGIERPAPAAPRPDNAPQPVSDSQPSPPQPDAQPAPAGPAGTSPESPDSPVAEPAEPLPNPEMQATDEPGGATGPA